MGPSFADGSVKLLRINLKSHVGWAERTWSQWNGALLALRRAMISQVDRKCGFCCELLLRLQWVRLVNSVEPVHSANAQGMANAVKCGENLILLHIWRSGTGVFPLLVHVYNTVLYYAIYISLYCI